MLDAVRWLGHASFQIDGTPSIVIDPYRIVKDDETPNPDVILVSHEHYDHCSPADIQKLMGPNTQVIASRSAAEMLDGNVTVLRPWQQINLGRTSIRTVPAYTFRGDHPAHRENLGFVISSNYTDIYYAGDTDFVPELRSLRCDIAILPIAGRDGLMDLESIIDFVQVASPRYVIPSHWGSTLEGGGRVELNAFLRAMDNLLVEVVTPDQQHRLFA